MKKLVEIRPKYDRGIHAMRLLMKRRNLLLECLNDSELVQAYNSDMNAEEFDALLKECRDKAPKAVSYLIRCIKRQEFKEG